jgi:hypothetical protein
MIRQVLTGLASMFILSSLSYAQQTAPKGNSELLRQQGNSVRTITPIFSQLVTFSSPTNFRPVFENTSGVQYLRESVLEGETVNKWSQMITVTGARSMAQDQNVTPEIFARRLGGGFRRNCPESFNAGALGVFKVSGYDAYAVVLSCGVARPTGEPYSESMLLIVVKGENDYYTIQWAERGASSRSPIKLDDPKWIERFQRLAPIRLCPIVAGEAAPYPSCVDRK